MARMYADNPEGEEEARPILRAPCGSALLFPVTYPFLVTPASRWLYRRHLAGFPPKCRRDGSGTAKSRVASGGEVRNG